MYKNGEYSVFRKHLGGLVQASSAGAVLLFVFALVIWATAFSVRAASLRISPIGLDLPANERAASLTLVNTGSAPVNLQLRVFQWQQVDNADVLEPTTDLMVSPPAATVPPGASYTVRVARTATSAVVGELSYRLLIDELPRPVDPRTVDQGVSMVLRTSMPVFFAAPQAKAQLTWRLWRDADGLHAEATNHGDRHAKIAGLSVQDDQRRAFSFGSGLNGYVLAGAQKRFDLPDRAAGLLVPGQHLTLTARNGALEIHETLLVGER